MHRLILLSMAYLSTLLIAFDFVLPDAGYPAAGYSGLSVVRITPAGTDVPTGRQIVFEFNRAVVPVGRMERDAAEVPITISPEVDCQWRRLNNRALACWLDETDALKPATRYDIVVNPGIKTEDGATLAEPMVHWFITERPKVRYAWFRTWKAPGMPFIRLTFNQPVSRESVGKHVFMMTDDPNGQRIGLKVEPDPDDQQTPLILPLAGEKITLAPDPDSSTQTTVIKPEKSPADRRTTARRIWLISPKVEITPDTQVALKVAPGLVSSSGPERGVENRVLVAFHTFPEFGFEGIECTDNTNKKITIGTAEKELRI
jgi:hypothetical protein